MLLYWLTFWLVSGSPSVHHAGAWRMSLIVIVVLEVLIDIGRVLVDS